MPSCKAFGCANTSGRTFPKISYYKFPNPEKEKARTERWLHNIGTGCNINSFNFQSSVVCSDHFHPNCFQKDMLAKTLKVTPKQNRLKDGAIPTIFSYKTYDVINMDGEVATINRSSSLKRSADREHDEVRNLVVILVIVREIITIY